MKDAEKGDKNTVHSNCKDTSYLWRFGYRTEAFRVPPPAFAKSSHGHDVSQGVTVLFRNMIPLLQVSTPSATHSSPATSRCESDSLPTSTMIFSAARPPLPLTPSKIRPTKRLAITYVSAPSSLEIRQPSHCETTALATVPSLQEEEALADAAAATLPSTPCPRTPERLKKRNTAQDMPVYNTPRGRYHVWKITDRRDPDLYHVSWIGYTDASDNTWEPRITLVEDGFEDLCNYVDKFKLWQQDDQTRTFHDFKTNKPSPRTLTADSDKLCYVASVRQAATLLGITADYLPQKQLEIFFSKHPQTGENGVNREPLTKLLQQCNTAIGKDTTQIMHPVQGRKKATKSAVHVLLSPMNSWTRLHLVSTCALLELQLPVTCSCFFGRRARYSGCTIPRRKKDSSTAHQNSAGLFAGYTFTSWL